MTSYWDNLEFWEKLDAPLRPTSQVVSKFQEYTQDSDSVLLLGCTKELYTVNDNVIVVDVNQRRIDMLKPIGRVICGDWMNLTNELDCKVDTIIGDGSMNCVKLNDWQILIDRAKLVLNPGGKIVIRVFETPAIMRTLKQIKDDVLINKYTETFSSLKWDIAMYLAYSNCHVAVTDVYDMFNLLFDKEELHMVTGWPIDTINTIDAYNNDTTVYCFPSEKQIRRIFPRIMRKQVLGYPFAERCPFYFFY
jgi:hypothetical protein